MTLLGIGRLRQGKGRKLSETRAHGGEISFILSRFLLKGGQSASKATVASFYFTFCGQTAAFICHLICYLLIVPRFNQNDNRKHIVNRIKLVYRDREIMIPKL